MPRAQRILEGLVAALAQVESAATAARHQQVLGFAVRPDRRGPGDDPRAHGGVEVEAQARAFDDGAAHGATLRRRGRARGEAACKQQPRRGEQYRAAHRR